MWQRLNCALGRHSYINDPDFAPGDITAPATCACGATRAPIIWDRGQCAEQVTRDADRQQLIDNIAFNLVGKEAAAAYVQNGRITVNDYRSAIARQSKPPVEPAFERAQIITAKAGDTIAVMSDAYMSANERLLLIALFQAKLPEGVKVMVLDRGMKLVHVEAAAANDARPRPHIPQPQ